MQNHWKHCKKAPVEEKNAVVMAILTVNVSVICSQRRPTVCGLYENTAITYQTVEQVGYNWFDYTGTFLGATETKYWYSFTHCYW